MPVRALIFTLSLLVAPAAAGTLFWLFSSGTLHSSCAYGPGKTRNSCKPRPEPSAAEREAAIDGTALTAALEAFRRSVDRDQPVVGVGINRWAEVSIALPTGKTAIGVPRERFVRTGRNGEPLRDIRHALYEDVAGWIPFDIDQVQPQRLTESLARADRPTRFVSARLEPSFGEAGLAWRVSFATRDQQDPQGAMYAMAIDGSGLCRLDSFSTSPGVPACNLARLPSTPMPSAQAAQVPAGPAFDPTTDPASADAFAQMACVKNAKGDVAALQRCVQR